MNYPEKLFYVGRLDKDSEGLLLLTNDGELDQAISRARNQHEKEYEVIVDHPVTRKFVQQMEKGVPILDTVTRPCKVRQKGERAFTIILTQGLNRQIRRMCEYCGYRVRRLKRVRIMNIRLGEMQPGQYRELSRQELEELRDLL
jgi:23S rRNA pseudouridine2604 synthase